MDVKGFRKFCGSLNELTGPQLKELLSALKSLDARMQALGASETRRGEPGAWPSIAPPLTHIAAKIGVPPVLGLENHPDMGRMNGN